MATLIVCQPSLETQGLNGKGGGGEGEGKEKGELLIDFCCCPGLRIEEIWLEK